MTLIAGRLTTTAFTTAFMEEELTR